MTTAHQPPGTYAVRPIDPAESDAFRVAMSVPFGFDPHPDDAVAFRDIFEFDRSVCAFDGDVIVGTCMAFSFEMTVPGACQLPMAGTTVITVLPTHRRRGALRSMMRAHFDEIRQHNDPIAALWASESSIYGRFGYGAAADLFETEIDAAAIRFVNDPPSGDVRLIDGPAAATTLPALFDRVRRVRPGMFGRSETWWHQRLLRDPEHRREGKTALRFAVYTGDDGLDGYAMFRQKAEWGDFPAGQISVVEVVAATGAAHEALWRFLLAHDLFPKVRAWNQPVDDELPLRITDPRRVQRQASDAMWIRLLDIPAALETRRYGITDDITIGVDDQFLPDNSGVYRLRATPEGASCRRDDTAAPDVTIPVDALGAIYLGGQDLNRYHRAGRVTAADPATIRRLDLLFKSTGDRAPWCQEVF